MKKTVLLLALFTFIFVSAAHSQQKPFVFGFKAGPNMGWMKPESPDYESTGVKGGFSWGFIVDFFLMENYGITTGFDVVFQNGGLSMPHMDVVGIDTLTGTLDRKYKLKYIQIPVTFKMRTNELGKGKLKIYGQIGLGTNFLIGAKADDVFTPEHVEASTDEVDIYDDISFMKESLILGAGVEISLGGSTNLLAGITYNNGFTDVLTGTNSGDPNVSNKAYANYVSLDIGIVF
jgi:hypothetical protein